MFINVQGKWRPVNFIPLDIFDGRILGIAYIGVLTCGRRASLKKADIRRRAGWGM